MRIFPAAIPAALAPRRHCKGSRLKEVLEKHNVPLKDFLTSERVETADGKFLMIAKDALDCDALISVSKMKTHALERITGAVKNQYGCISGVYKKLGHTQYPNAESFAHMLIELNQKVAPRLYICDGIVAMEGNGPIPATRFRWEFFLCPPIRSHWIPCSAIW